MTEFWIVFFIVLIGLILVCIAAVLVRYSRDIRVARKRVKNLGSQVIETACGPIEYARVGEGYPILIIHGAIGGFDQGLYIAQSIGFLKCQIISVSRFGHLRSPLPRNANLDMQADAYSCLLDALEIKQVAVFAISAGSTSGIRFTARHPERVSALILFGPDAPGKSQIVLPPRFVFDILFRSNFIYWILITYFRKSMQKKMGLVPEGFISAPKHTSRINNILLGDLPIDRRIDGLIFETYTTANEYYNSVTASSPYPLENIKTPVLIVNALDDPITTAENIQALAEKFPNKNHFIVPDGGHLFFNHDIEVKSAILHFLSINITELSSMD
ncbi:MAG: alpha/beta fold hydrolase [Flexilinea sp.]